MNAHEPKTELLTFLPKPTLLQTCCFSVNGYSFSLLRLKTRVLILLLASQSQFVANPINYTFRIKLILALHTPSAAPTLPEPAASLTQIVHEPPALSPCFSPLQLQHMFDKAATAVLENVCRSHHSSALNPLKASRDLNTVVCACVIFVTTLPAADPCTKRSSRMSLVAGHGTHQSHSHFRACGIAVLSGRLFLQALRQLPSSLSEVPKAVIPW